MAAGKRHLLLRAKRALKGMGLIDKKGKTVGISLLVRSVAAQATISARDGQAHTTRSGTVPRARNARPYGQDVY